MTQNKDFSIFTEDQILIKRIWYSVFTRDKKTWLGNKYGNSRSYISYVLKGSVKISFTDGHENILAPKGSSFFIPAGCGFIVEYLEPGTTLKTLLFDCQITPSIPLDVNFFLDSTKINLVFESIDATANKGVMYLSAKVLELLALVKDKQDIRPKKHSTIEPALNSLESKYFENHKTAYYAELCGLSESHFRRIFKEIMGKPFTEYKNDVRISYVKKIMETEKCSMTEAAYLAGFNNMSHFFEQRRKRLNKP